MTVQWPLIIFTTLVAWSAGLFASQCVLAIRGKASMAQMPAWIVSAILLVAGGVAVFLHLEYWERIFNGFGHISSGITQELIAIVVLAVVAVVYLILLRVNKGKAPIWIAIIGIVASVILIVVMAHSYMMASRPAWDTPAWILYILGNACAFGPLTLAIIVDVIKDKQTAAQEQKNEGEEVARFVGLFAVVGTAVNLLGAAVYGAVLQMSAGSFASVGRYADPTNFTKDLVDATTVIGNQTMLSWVGAVAVGAVLALLIALYGKKSGNWKVAGVAAVICVLVGAVCMRLAFYHAGVSVFMFY